MIGRQNGLETSSAQIVKTQALKEVMKALASLDVEIRPATLTDDAAKQEWLVDLLKPTFFQHTSALAQFSTTMCAAPEAKLVLEGRVMFAAMPLAAIPGDTYKEKQATILEMDAERFTNFVKSDGCYMVASPGTLVVVPMGFGVIEIALDAGVHGLRWTIFSDALKPLIANHLKALIRDSPSYAVEPFTKFLAFCQRAEG